MDKPPVVEWFCQMHGCKITVLGKTELSPYQELMHDFMSIMHCFSSRLYFLRRYKDEMKSDPEINLSSSLGETVCDQKPDRRDQAFDMR
ncbi:resolvase domain protein [Kalymmatonema gypsitolerans NIES-4073]|nr:resolvase domain protein [Scytonema sp. NIES-4073]